MSTFQPPEAQAANIEQQMNGLLALVESDRARQSAHILGEAQQQARLVRDEAQAQARARVRQTYTEQRRLLQDGVAAAQARLATQRRLHEQQRSAALLQLAWQGLPKQLQAQWQSPAGRSAWVARVLAAARTHMPSGAWRILHAPDWPAAEQQALAQQLSTTQVTLQFEADTRIAAGLKVSAGGNVIDGTLDGLLADRAALEARLLRLLEAAA